MAWVKRHLCDITKIQLENLLLKLKKIGIQAKVTDRAISEIAKAGFDPIYGARPLKEPFKMKLKINFQQKFYLVNF